MPLNSIFQTARQWFSKTPERALDQAYRATIKIKDIEDKHFQGQKVSTEFSDYGETAISYFRTEVNGYLRTIRIKLAEFKVSRLFFKVSDLKNYSAKSDDQMTYVEEILPSSTILEKLNFIDKVIAKYKIPESRDRRFDKDQSQSLQNPVNSTQIAKARSLANRSLFAFDDSDITPKNGAEKATDKSGVLPRSFIRSINRIKQEIDPQSGETEEAVLKRFRNSRYKTAISLKFILLLIIVPLLVHQLTKTFFLNPIIKNYFKQHEQVVFINQDLENEALSELKNFEENLRFRNLIGLSPNLSQVEVEKQVKEKALEISGNYRNSGVNAVANVFSDIFSLIAFAIIILMSRREIEIVKSFLDEILYNLSDSAKAFLIILFTDMFVGFHSPHGWEVLLVSFTRHFGLPQNIEFNFLFIATFPVILDTIFKYWIFRYLNRISPSAVATYRNMNE